MSARNRWRLKNQTACKPGSVRFPPLLASLGRATVIPLDRPLLDGSRDLPGRPGPASPASALSGLGASSLFGLAPSGACHAVPVARSAVGSYPTLSPFPPTEVRGGLLSVALSLGSPPAGVTRRLFAVEPGLSSSPQADPRPPGRLVRLKGGLARWRGQGWGAASPASRRRSDPRRYPSRTRIPAAPLRVQSRGAREGRRTMSCPA